MEATEGLVRISEHEELRRSVSSGAVLNVNAGAAAAHRRQRDLPKRVDVLEQLIIEMQQQIRDLKDDLSHR